MGTNNPVNTEIYDLPLWSAPFGVELLESINYSSKIKKILDIGSGDGFPILELAQRFGNSSMLYGIDIDQKSVNKLNNKIFKNNIKNVIIKNMSTENLTFKNNYFDLVISNNGINNVSDKEKAFSEISRICKPNAELIFTFNLEDTYTDFNTIFISVLKRYDLNTETELFYKYIHYKRPKIEQIKKYLSLNNFKTINIIQDDFNMSFTNGTSFLNHYFIKKWFLPEWLNIIRNKKREMVVSALENELNKLYKGNFIKFNVPFVCIKCRKVKNGIKK